MSVISIKQFQDGHQRIEDWVLSPSIISSREHKVAKILRELCGVPYYTSGSYNNHHIYSVPFYLKICILKYIAVFLKLYKILIRIDSWQQYLMHIKYLTQ